MKIRAVLMAIALLFGFAGSMGGVGAPSAEAQRYDRGPGADRDYRRPPPRRYRPAPRGTSRHRGYRNGRSYRAQRGYRNGRGYRAPRYVNRHHDRRRHRR